MTGPRTASRAPSRLQTLKGFLTADPNNLTLLADAAETALKENEVPAAREFLARYAAVAPLPDKERGLAGVAAMRAGDFGQAAHAFRALLAQSPSDPALRFNLAWSLAMLKDFEESLKLLDPATVAHLPQAAMLHVQLLHDQGNVEEAADLARQYIERHPDDEGLLSAVSVLALDIDDRTLAEACASRATSQPDALATLGTLALADADRGRAHELFSRALEGNSNSARAWIGKGLSQLFVGPSAQAAADIERGADIFVEHAGSWLTAGWAHLLADNIAKARSCFEKARIIDDSFADAHGSLALLDIIEGNAASARRSAERALQLDANSFAGALATASLMQGEKPELAREIVRRALDAPIDASGRTLASALAVHGLKLSRE